MTGPPSESLRPRSAWRVLALGLTLASAVLVFVLLDSMRVGPVAPPIEVTVELNPPRGGEAETPPTEDRDGHRSLPRAAPSPDLLLIHVFYSGHQDPPQRAEMQGHRRRWRIEKKWARALLLAGAPDTLARVDDVTVRIGRKRVWRFKEVWKQECPVWEEPLRVDLPAGWEVRNVTAAIPRASSAFSFGRVVVNYPGDAGVLGRALVAGISQPAVVLILAALGAILSARYWLPRRLRDAAALDALLSPPLPAEEHHGEPAGRWALAGFVIMAGCLAFLQWRQPYYFVQDDNFSQFLPGMLAGCRAVFAGYLPDWNPYQYLGAPLAEVGTYALTYPVTYLSYAVATWGLRDEFATMDVFCSIHLVAGYAASFWLGRRLGLTAPLAAALALCWSLCGYALLVGRSWYYMTPSFVGYPLLAVAVLSLQRSAPTWRWVLGTGLVIGLLFHAGNAQMWAYGMEFFGLWILLALLTRTLPWKRLPAVGAALAVGLGLAAVLLIPQFLATVKLERNVTVGYDLLPGTLALLFPYPIAWLGESRFWCGIDGQYILHVYYAGSLLTLGWLLGLILAAAFQGRGKAFWKNPLFALSVVAMALALGNVGLLWPLHGFLPVFNKFGHALKYLPLFHLFALAMGALVVQRLLRSLELSAVWQRGCFVVVAVLMIYHVTLATPSFYTYGDTPYPPLPKPVQEWLSQDSPRLLAAEAPSSASPRLLAAEAPSSASPRLLAGEGPQQNSPPPLGEGPQQNSPLPLGEGQQQNSPLPLGEGQQQNSPLPLGEGRGVRAERNQTAPQRPTTARPTRVLPICPVRSTAKHYVFGLNHNFPTTYRIEALTGYDPLVEMRPAYRAVTERLEEDFVGTLRRYGVTDVVVHRLSKWPVWNGNQLARMVEWESLYRRRPVRAFCERHEPVLTTEDLWIYAVDDPDPLAFPAGDRRRALPLARTPAGLEVDVSPLVEGGPVVINYLWYPRIRVTADGTALTSSADRWGRIVVDVPSGTQTLSVRYVPPWRLGLGLGAVLIALGTVGYGLTRRRPSLRE